MQRLSESHDGKWGRQIREYKRRQAEALTVQDFAVLRRIAEQAQSVIPGPWAVTEANFITCKCLDSDPETGKIVAEVDCYDEHPQIKTAFISTFDPATCIKLLNMLEGR